MPKKKPSEPIGEKLGEEIYQWWVRNDCNMSETARHYKRSRSTIHRLSMRGHVQSRWRVRYAKLKKQSEKKTDRRLAGERTQNAKIVGQWKNMLALHFMKPGEICAKCGRAGVDLNKIPASEFREIIKLEEELTGQLPGPDDKKEEEVPPEIKEMLRIVTSLPAKVLDSIGNYIVENDLLSKVRNNGSSKEKEAEKGKA